MTNIASDEATLELNLTALDARLAALADSPVLRERLERARADMDALRFPVQEYDPTQQGDDDKDL